MEKKMHNPYISNTLRLALAKKYNMHISEITKEFLGTLKEIDLSDNNIRDIKGIEFATNATYINLTRNNICDASNLSKLINLTSLELTENKIEDISFLKNLKKLKSIGLDSNNISKVPNLDDNNNLDLINLDNNKVIDLSQFNTSKFKSITLLASDQCVVLDPIKIHCGKTVLFKSNIKWNFNTMVFFDNVQVSGNYESVYSDDRPSILYSISEVVIKNVKSDTMLKMDFYHEDNTTTPRVFGGTLIQPIYIIGEDLESIENKEDKNLSIIKGTIEIDKQFENLYNTNNNEFKLINKTITLINEFGGKVNTYTNNNGEYVFTDIVDGKYILLFPVLSESIYTSPSVYILKIKNNEEYIINGLFTFIKE